MSIAIQARTYANGAENIAARREIRQRLFHPVKAKPTPVFAVVEQDTVEIEKSEELRFDFHETLRDRYFAGQGHPIKTHIRKRAQEFGFTYDEIVGPRRYRELIIPRQTIMWEIRNIVKPSASLMEISRHFGDRDHSTILHALRKIQAMKDRGEID